LETTIRLVARALEQRKQSWTSEHLALVCKFFSEISNISLFVDYILAMIDYQYVLKNLHYREAENQQKLLAV
jgi:endo-beta-N-acetylglucosaminidase D